MNKKDKVITYLKNRDPRKLQENLVLAYDLVKHFSSNSDEERQIRGDIAEFVNKQIVDNIIMLNPNIEGKPMYSPIFKGNNKSTELDSILISNVGVFSIEVKSFYGQYVVTSDGLFTRTYPSKTIYKVLAQNSSHCRYIYSQIKDLIPNQNPYGVKGIIVVFGDCSFIDKRTDIEKEICPICYPWDLYKHIKINQKMKLNSDIIYKRLMSKADFSKKAREDHIKYIKSLRK
ncbi:nuclease-related domain-containing protein [Clostridium tertium]|uniref:nuclease-related domain-containing protein n=1 Tax=Clostridium tertium TaxID=1559 RepID=UPI0023B27A53|nr:nuclease-related domain-containing protein [Clostridium tertium]